MTEYAVLLPGDESAGRTCRRGGQGGHLRPHEEFAKALEERGHKMTGGAELTHSREAKVLRTTPTGSHVTDGPYAETVEQLTGFYLVETDDLDDLVEVSKILGRRRGRHRDPGLRRRLGRRS